MCSPRRCGWRCWRCWQGRPDRPITGAAQSGPITARSLWLATQSGYKEYLKTPLTRYILATTLPTGSINNDYATTLNDAKILVTRYLPRRFEKTRRSVIADAKEYILGDAPPLFENGVVVRVLAREHYAAFEMALRQLDLLRGIWNLWENRNTQFRWTSGRVRPFNKFLLGPVHTLHKPDGALAHDSWWYETHYVRPSFSSMRDSEISSRQKFTKQVRLLLRQSKYRVPLESAIVRYSRALDFDDTNTSFLQLWSVLEYLTGISDSRDGSAALIRRASYLSADPEYTRHELNVLRNHRNESVHAESRKGDADTYRILTKNHVERLLEFRFVSRNCG